MRIGLDARGETGIGRYSEHLIRELLRLHPEHTYVVFANAQIARQLDDVSSHKSLELVPVDVHYYSFQEQFFYPFEIMKHKVDLMHFLHFNVPFWYPGPFVVTIHDLILSFFPGNQRGLKGLIKKVGYPITLRRAVGGARHIIAVSNKTVEDLVSVSGVSDEQVSMIYEGVDKAMFGRDFGSIQRDILREKYGIGDNFFLYVGVWTHHKNVTGLIEAFAQIVQKDRLPNYQLVIPGKHDLRHPEIFDTIQEQGVSDRVITPGFVEDEELAWLYDLASVFVFPSFYEGFGLPPLEALQAGTPVASSNASCMPEILGDAAVYFDPYDIQDMARVMTELATDERLREQVLEAAPTQLLRYNWEDMAAQTFSVYERVFREISNT